MEAFSSKLPVGYAELQTPDEGRTAQRPKLCDGNTQHEDNYRM